MVRSSPTLTRSSTFAIRRCSVGDGIFKAFLFVILECEGFHIHESRLISRLRFGATSNGS